MCSEHKTFLSFFLSLLLCSCSVKESRRDCPCHLYLDFSQVSREQFDSVQVLLDGARGGERRVPLSLTGLHQATLAVDVPRDHYQANVCAMENGAFWLTDGQEEVMEIPRGEECPPLYLHSARLEATGDEYVETVVLHKNFCTLHIRMEGNDPSQAYPFALRVRGGIDGYDRFGRPRPGDFGAPAYPTADGRCSVRVPRQTDDSLQLQIVEDGRPLASFAIGEYIRSGGYDWTAPDLADVSLRIDCAALSLQIKIDNWSETYYFNVEI